MEEETEQYKAFLVPYAMKRDPNQQKKCFNFNCYEVASDLGKGAFGDVKKVYRTFQEKEDGPIFKWPYACKILSKKELLKQQISGEDEDGLPCFLNGYQVLEKELEIYQYLDSKNICKLFEIIKDEEEIGDFPEYIFLILQYCDLGELMEWDHLNFTFKRNTKLENFIQQKYNIGRGIGNGLGISQTLGISNKYSSGILKLEQNLLIERTAQIIFYQVLKGIQYLHQNNIANRDIKPQNILCKSFDESNGNHIKLADFSIARKMENKEDLVSQICGTPGIQSPEQTLIEEYLPLACDIWSFGITLYCFIMCKLPWEINLKGDQPIDLQLENAVQEQEIEFDQAKFSHQLIDLIQNCCRKDPQQRFTIDQALNHAWFCQIQF